MCSTTGVWWRASSHPEPHCHPRDKQRRHHRPLQSAFSGHRQNLQYLIAPACTTSQDQAVSRILHTSSFVRESLYDIAASHPRFSLDRTITLNFKSKKTYNQDESRLGNVLCAVGLERASASARQGSETVAAAMNLPTRVHKQ